MSNTQPAVLIVGLLFCGTATFASEPSDKGRICVRPIHKLAPAADHDMPGGTPQRREPHYEFSVQIGERPPIQIPIDGSSQLVKRLPLADRHTVVIRDRDEIIESFHFRFEARGGTYLCLSYTPWYQTWQLDPPRSPKKTCGCSLEAE